MDFQPGDIIIRKVIQDRFEIAWFKKFEGILRFENNGKITEDPKSGWARIVQIPVPRNADLVKLDDYRKSTPEEVARVIAYRML